MFLFRIESDDPSCFGIRCAAHSLQLLLRDLEATPLVRGATSTMETLLELLDSPEKQEKLKDYQRVAGKREGCIPIKPVETRFELPYNFNYK